MTIMTYLIGLVPVYIGIIILFIRVEHRFSVLETDMQWIKDCFMSGDFCVSNEKDGD